MQVSDEEPDELKQLLQRMKSRRAALEQTSDSSEDDVVEKLLSNSSHSATTPFQVVSKPRQYQLSDSDDDANQISEHKESQSIIPTTDILSFKESIVNDSKPTSIAAGNESNQDSDTAIADSSDEDSDGNVYAHSKPPKKVKKLSKKALLELRKETQRLLRERQNEVEIRKSTHNLDSFLAARGINRNSNPIPKVVHDEAITTTSPKLSINTLSSIHDNVLASTNDSIQSANTLIVDPPAVAISTNIPTESLILPQISVKVDRIISKEQEPYARLGIFPSLGMTSKSITLNAAGKSTVNLGDSDECELEIVAFESPGFRKDSQQFTYNDNDDKSAPTSPSRIRPNGVKPISKKQQNIKLMRLAEEQIRLRREVEMEQRQRQLDEKRLKREKLRLLRTAVAQAKQLDKSAENVTDTEPVQDSNDVNNNVVGSESETGSNKDINTSTRFNSSYSFSNQSTRKSDTKALANCLAIKKVHDNALQSDSMEILLSDRDASDAVAKELGLWEVDKSNQTDMPNDENAVEYGTDDEEDPSMFVDTHQLLLDLDDSMSDVEVSDSNCYQNVATAENHSICQPFVDTMLKDNLFESTQPSEHIEKRHITTQVPVRKDLLSGTPEVSGILEVLPFLSGSFPSTDTTESLKKASRVMPPPQTPLHSRSLLESMPDSVKSVTSADEAVKFGQADDILNEDADFMALLSGNFEPQDETTRDAQLQSLLEISKMQAQALESEKASREKDSTAFFSDEEAQTRTESSDTENDESNSEKSDDTSDNEADDTTSNASASVETISQVNALLPKIQPFVSIKKSSKFVETEAEVEDDEFMHVGGVDGEDDPDIDQYEQDMLGDSDIEDMQQEAIANLHLKQLLEKDKSEFEALLNDVTSGNLRKRGRRNDPTGKGLDMHDSDEENEELLRRIRDQFKSKTNGNDNDDLVSLEKLAQDPKTASFAKCFSTDMNDVGGIMSSDSEPETMLENNVVRIKGFSRGSAAKLHLRVIAEKGTHSDSNVEEQEQQIDRIGSEDEITIDMPRKNTRRQISSEDDSDSPDLMPVKLSIKPPTKVIAPSLSNGISHLTSRSGHNLDSVQSINSGQTVYRELSILEEQTTSVSFTKMMQRKVQQYKAVENTRSQSQNVFYNDSFSKQRQLRFASAERFLVKRSFSESQLDETAQDVIHNGVGRNAGKRNMAFQIRAKDKIMEADGEENQRNGRVNLPDSKGGKRDKSISTTKRAKNGVNGHGSGAVQSVPDNGIGNLFKGRSKIKSMIIDIPNPNFKNTDMARVKHKRKATAAHSSPNRKRNATAKNSSDLTAATGQPSSLESLAYKNTPSKASPIPTYQTLDLVSDSEQEEVIGHNTRHRVLIDNKTPRPIIESVEQQSDVDSPRSNILQKQQKTRHDDASPVKSRVTTRSSSQRSIDTHPKSIPNSRPSMSSFDEQQQMGDGGYELDQVPGQLIAHSVQDQTDDLCVESTLDQESPAHEVMVEHAEDSDLKPEQLPTTHLSWDYKEDDIPAKYCSFNNSVRTPTKQHSHRIKSKVSHSNPRRDSDEPHSGSSSSKSIQYRNLASDDVTPLSRRSTSKAAEAFVMVTPVKANPSYQISVYPEIVNSIDLDSFNYLLAKLYDGRWLELHTPQGEVVDVNLLNDELPTYIATAKANAVEAFTHNVWRKHALLELSDMPHSIAKHLVVAQSLLNVDEVIMLRNQFNDKGHEFTFTQRHRHFTKLASKLVKLLKLLISPGFKLAEKRGDLFGLLMSYIHFQIFFSRMSAGPKADISSAEPRTLFKKYESFNILDEAFEIHPNELAEMSTSQIHNYEARMEKLKTMSAYALNKALLSESLAPFNLIEETLRSVILQVMRPIEKDAIPEFYEGPLRYLPAEPSSICCEKITESIKNAHVAFTDAVKDPLTCIESNLNISKKSRAVLRSPPIHQSNHRVKLGQLPSKSASKSPKRVSDSTKSPKRQIKPPSEQLNSEHHHIRFLPVTLYPPDVDVLEDESKLKKIRRQKMAWTAEESDALYKGMEKYQRQWRKILDEYPVLHSRTNVDLKDHCRSMLKKRIRNNEDPGVWGI